MNLYNYWDPSHSLAHQTRSSSADVNRSSQATPIPLHVDFEYQSTDLIYQSGAASSEIGVHKLTSQIIIRDEGVAVWHAPRMNEQQLVVDPRAFYRLTYEVGNRFAMYSEQEYMELLRKAIELELRYKQEKAG